MPRRDEEFPAPVGTVIGFGLPLSHESLHHPLVDQAPGEDPSKPVVRDWEARINGIVDRSQWGRDQYGGEYRQYFNLKQNWYHIPFDELRREFTTDELYRMLYRSYIMSDLSERFAHDPHYTPLHKVTNSTWQYGRMAKDDYGLTVRLYRGLGRFDFGVPGFTAYFDHTDWECGTEKYARYGKELVAYKDKERAVAIWLDGVFAYHVVRDGKIVLTIGFSLSQKGVLVSQIQVRGQKKGNRWLYKLGRGLREHVIDRMRAAWPDFPVHLITGASQMAYNKYTHRSDTTSLPDAVAERTAAFYAAPLAGYAAGEVVRTSAGWGPCRDFRELIPAPSAPAQPTAVTRNSRHEVLV